MAPHVRRSAPPLSGMLAITRHAALASSSAQVHSHGLWYSAHHQSTFGTPPEQHTAPRKAATHHASTHDRAMCAGSVSNTAPSLAYEMTPVVPAWHYTASWHYMYMRERPNTASCSRSGSHASRRRAERDHATTSTPVAYGLSGKVPRRLTPDTAWTLHHLLHGHGAPARLDRRRGRLQQLVRVWQLQRRFQ
eukprot:2211990-Prymnesium_polylepis.1